MIQRCLHILTPSYENHMHHSGWAESHISMLPCQERDIGERCSDIKANETHLDRNVLVPLRCTAAQWWRWSSVAYRCGLANRARSKIRVRAADWQWRRHHEPWLTSASEALLEVKIMPWRNNVDSPRAQPIKINFRPTFRAGKPLLRTHRGVHGWPRRYPHETIELIVSSQMIVVGGHVDLARASCCPIWSWHVPNIDRLEIDARDPYLRWDVS